MKAPKQVVDEIYSSHQISRISPTTAYAITRGDGLLSIVIGSEVAGMLEISKGDKATLGRLKDKRWVLTPHPFGYTATTVQSGTTYIKVTSLVGTERLIAADVTDDGIYFPAGSFVPRETGRKK